MKFGKTIPEDTDSVPMVPLIDIMFLTLVFFLATYTYSSMEAEVDVTLPTAASAQYDDRSQGEIYINIQSDGTYVINGREVEIAELQEILDRVAQYFPGGSVIIRGDTESALGRAVAVLDACKQSDIQNVSIAAVPEDRAGAN
jgi:biopolymer transport protein ExbD